MVSHLTYKELTDGLSEIRQSPADKGILKAIVVRPVSDERTSLAECKISPELGVHGDNWAKGCWMSLPDGRPDPDVQIAITNSRAIGLIAQDEDRWQLAGDILYADLDLSADILRTGQQLSVGSAILEITEVAHNACKKFAERFGTDAAKFINSEVGRKLHLRGIYAKVVQAGTVHVGDVIEKR
jgi:hypothetical protein